MGGQWKKAQSVAELGHLMADWLEGRHNAYSPSSLSNEPDEETLPLVPILAACNRAGFVTTDSQPGDKGIDDGVTWEQRAAVTGWVADKRLLDRIRLNARRAGLDIVAHRPDSGWRDGAAVTRVDGKDYTWFGRTEGRRKQVAFEWAEASGQAMRELRRSTYITIFDPVWGRDNRLWPALQQAVR